MKEQIIKSLTDNLSMTQEELIALLGLKTIEEYQEMNQILNELINSFTVYNTKREKYMLFENSHFKKGNIEITRNGNAFLLQPDGDIYVSAKNLNGAMNKDLVIVEPIESNGKKDEGKVVKVIAPALDVLVGTVYIQNATLYVKPGDKKLNQILEIIKDKHLGSVDGDVVKCKPISHRKEVMLVEVVEIVANHNDPDKDMLLIMAKHDIEPVFNDQVLAEAKEVASEVDPEEVALRRDLREELIFTIDGDDTRDIDDAISLTEDDEGYHLGVHIADVANYVLPGTAIDESAMARGTSVYLVDRVVPMLPKVLSNGICSLNPNVDRLAMSININLDRNANIVNYEVFESVIRSRKQCTYGGVNQILEENIVPEGYEEFSETLLKMNELALKLRSKMDKRGYIEFDSDEVKFKLDENNKIIEIIKREQHAGEKLIENYMILANECVSTFLQEKNIPSVYRVHDLPSPEKIREFISYVALLGYQVSGNFSKKQDKYTPLDVQSLMHCVVDKKEYPILSNLLLRSMKKAIYSTDNIGHFGLGSVCYTHFTSPIRRYPDTTIHRLLKMVLHKEYIDKPSLLKKLIYVTDLSSQREQAAVECEREVDDMKMAEYMMDHIGEEFVGMVVSVHPFGMFVKLENLIEGLAPIDKMKGYFTFVEEQKMLLNNKNGQRYRLGDTIKVKCIDANKDTREIDFEVIVDEPNKEKTETP